MIILELYSHSYNIFMQIYSYITYDIKLQIMHSCILLNNIYQVVAYYNYIHIINSL